MEATLTQNETTTQAKRTRRRDPEATSQGAAPAPAPAQTDAGPELEITAQLHASGALFNIDELYRTDKGPKMSGSLRDEHGASVPVSLFIDPDPETGEVKYASLALGGQGRTHHYGKLFHTDKRPGEGPMYSGFIVVLPVERTDQYTQEEWEKAPRLQVCGWRRRNANGTARISLQVAPRLVGDDELAY